jgi:outer membrane protein assembly factor BamA
VRLRATLLRHPPAFSVNYIGGTSGLRGYGPYDLSGQSYVLCNLEQRYFSPLRIYTVCFGGAGFVDLGKTWNRASGFRAAEWRGDAGFSLLLGLSKMPERQVVRYDLAWRVTEPGFRWSVGYGMYFGI